MILQGNLEAYMFFSDTDDDEEEEEEDTDAAWPHSQPRLIPVY